jgi:D-alanyl-D-alanine carboxypeptidase
MFKSHRHIISQILLIFTIIAAAGAARADISDNLMSPAYVLMDADTGQVLMEYNMHSIRKPASITKIMTTLLAIEHGSSDDLVTVTITAVAANPSDGSSAGLMPGEVIPLDEILYAVMLESANEAANAVAEYVSGTMEDFALLMTRRAEELGALNTNFANPNGLNHDDHYTTPYDMAMITREAIKSNRFLTIWGTYQHFLEPTNLQSEKRIFNNKNRLLAQGLMPYNGILGGKTGFTSASQNTLVEVARRGDRTLICVLMQGPGALANFQDAVKLVDYGFGEFHAATFEDEEYEVSYDFLLHNDLEFDDIGLTYGDIIENEDGSTSVTVAITAPEDSSALMHHDISTLLLTSAPPPPPEPEPEPQAFSENIFAMLEQMPPFSWLASLFAMIAMLFGSLIDVIDLLPGWLALFIKIVLSLFALLFVAACFFRPRRWIRRRRRYSRRRLEARRRAYRQQTSYWS